jgi:hypothetical protein
MNTLLVASAATTLIGGMVAYFVIFTNPPAELSEQQIDSYNSGYFTEAFPAHPALQQELDQMRKTGKLQKTNESMILKNIDLASQKLAVPRAVLWCLLFQESRLNHLAGIGGERFARGMGQFSYYSFYEINHHLSRYTESNLQLVLQALGKDVRPISARESDIHNPSSYFYIPTAVTASASYLNNRYVQLQRNLGKRNVPYDPDLLWLYALMAYNKGTRSVLSLWNEAYRQGGMKQVIELLQSEPHLYQQIQDRKLIDNSMKRIWPDNMGQRYANELIIHMKNIRQCSRELNFKTSRWGGNEHG